MVVDNYNRGACALVLPRLLQEMTCTVIPLNASPAGLFMEQDEGAFNAHLQEMGVIASAFKAKLGVFIDNPGERAFLFDDTGRVLDHDTGLAVLTRLTLAGRT